MCLYLTKLPCWFSGRKVSSASHLPSKSCRSSSHQQSLTWEHMRKGDVGSSFQPETGVLLVVSWHTGVRHWTPPWAGPAEVQLRVGSPEKCSLLLSIKIANNPICYLLSRCHLQEFSTERSSCYLETAGQETNGWSPWLVTQDSPVTAGRYLASAA